MKIAFSSFTNRFAKSLVLCLGISLFSINSFSQSVGVGTTTPNAKSALDIVSTDQGLLVPRVDDAGMASIGASVAADDGMLVYNTSQDKFLYYEFSSDSWEPIAPGGSDADWIESGSVIYNESHYVVVGQQTAIAYIRMLVTNNGLRTALAGSSNGNGEEAIGVEGFASGGEFVDIGVFGVAQSTTSTDTVVGVYGEAKDILNVGAAVRGEANTGTDGISIVGGSFEARDDVGNGIINGVEAIADGNGVAKDAIGIRAAAFNAGGNNWAGYFEAGDVIVNDSVGINNIAPNERLTVGGMLSLAEHKFPPATSNGFGKYWVNLSGKPYFTNDAGVNYDLSATTTPDGNGIYGGSGSLIGATSVAQNANSLSFTGSGNVGFGVVPNAVRKIDVSTQNKVGILVQNNSATYASAWFDNNGGGLGLQVQDGDVYIQNGSVGIGTNIPSEKLDVIGGGRFSSTSYPTRSYTISSGSRQVITTTNDLIENIASGKVAIVNSSFSIASGNESTKFFTADAVNQRVGIRTVSPQSDLHISGGNTISTGWGFTYQQYESGYGVNATKPYLKNSWTSAPGDHLYIGGVGNRSNTLQSAIMLTENEGIKFGKGSDAGTSLSSEFVRFENSGRVEIFGNTDASGTAGSGMLEIGNGLRLDDNEIITNTNATMYLQNGNGGDLRVDATTLVVDASTNRVGVGTIAPAQTLDVEGSTQVDGEYYYETVKTHYKSYSGDGFSQVFDGRLRPLNVGSSKYYYFTGGSGLEYAAQRLDLPDGAVITGLFGRIYDNDATALGRVRIIRQLVGSATDASLATVETTSAGASATVQSLNATLSHTVDNQNYAYYVWVEGYANNTNIRFYGARVTYTVNKAD